MPNPTGADIEAYVNQRLSALLSNAQAPAGQSFTAAEYDFTCAKATIFPGPEWEFLSAFPLHVDVFILWRMKRTRQTELGMTPIMKREGQASGTVQLVPTR
jgi:hypothetical protein